MRYTILLLLCVIFFGIIQILNQIGKSSADVEIEKSAESVDKTISFFWENDEYNFTSNAVFNNRRIFFTYINNLIQKDTSFPASKINNQTDVTLNTVLRIIFGCLIAAIFLAGMIFLFYTKLKKTNVVTKKENDDLYRFLHDESPFAVVLLNKDIIVECNDKSIEIFGCRKAEIIGRSLYHFSFDNQNEDIHSKETYSDYWINASKGIPQVFEWKIKKADGANTDTYISLKKMEFDGEVRLGAIIQDISQIKEVQWLSRLIKTVADNITTPVFLIQFDGRCRYVNDQTCRELGYTLDEMRSVPIQNVIPEFSDGKWAEYCYSIKKDKKLIIELTMMRKNGEEFPAEMRANLFEFEGEEFFFAYSHDLSKRKIVEDALSVREEKYRLLIEKVPDVIYTTNQAGKKIFISPNVIKIFGYTPEEIYENEEEIWLNRIHQEDVAKVKYELESLFTNNTRYDLEYRIRRKDNTWIWLSDKASVTVELDGSRNAYGVISDFTEWKESENALAESEAKFRSVSEESPNMIFIYIKEKVVFVNNKCLDILGYTIEEIYAKDFDFFSVFIPGERDKAESEFNKYRREKDFGPSEYRLLTKKKEIIQVIINTKLIEYESDIAVLGIVTDITYMKLTEEFLRESEERYKAIFDSAAIGVFSTNLEGRILEVNQAVEEMLGYSAEELQNINFTDIAYSEDRKGDLLCFQDLVTEKRGSYQLEIRHVHKNENIIWNRLTASLVYDTDEKPKFVIAMLEDITDRKNTQVDLIKSEETYRLLIENAREGVISIDNQGKILLINESAANFLDGKPKDFFGRSLKDIFQAKLAREWLDLINGVIKSKTGINYEFSYETSSNQKYWIHSSMQPLRLKSGEIYGVLVLTRNMTRQKKIEDQLRESEQRYRTLFESMAQGAVYQNSKGIIFSVNPAATYILGLEQDQLIGQKTLDPTSSGIIEDGSRFMLSEHPSKIALKTGKRVTNTIMGIFNPQKKKRVWILIDSVPQFISSQKKPFQVFTTFTDITENKDSEETTKKSREQLRALTKHLQSVREEEKRMISREIHDEFGQILTALKMNLSLVSRELMENEKYLLEPKHLINEIMEMTRLTDSSLKQVRNIIKRLRPEILDHLGPVAALQWAADEFRLRSGINCELKTTVKNVTLDKERSIALFRIFQEALTNIARHSEATKVNINISMTDDNLKLKISDNGVGISEKEIDMSNSFGILGMKERIWFLGGELDISSKIRKGTEIKVSIPTKVIEN